MISHTGEVLGISDLVAVVVCSNEDGISLIGPLARQIAGEVLGGAPEKEMTQVRGVARCAGQAAGYYEDQRAVAGRHDASQLPRGV
jgi:hypothetical protein